MRHSDSHRLFTRSILWLPFLVATTTGAAAQQGEDGSTPAIWRIQSVPFEFRGDTVSYTCESFKKKVRAVLMSVGVHSSMIVQARCAPAAQAPFVRAPDSAKFGRESEGISSSAAFRMTALSTRISATIALAAPAIASEENIREATTFNTEQKLVARVNKEELPTQTEIPVFPAVWAAIELNGGGDAWFESSDCELLRQLSKQVFPKLGVQVTKTKLVCSASVTSKPSVAVRALVPMIRMRPPAESP